MRTSSGTTRLDIDEAASLLQLYELVLEHVPDAGLGKFVLSLEPASESVLPLDGSLPVRSLGLRYGRACWQAACDRL